MMITPELLTSPQESVRIRALEAMAADDDASESLPRMVCALGDKSWRVRQAAVAGLVRWGGKEAVAAVLRVMHDRHDDLAILNGAIQVLARAGVDTLGALTAFLSDDDAGLRTCVALALGAQEDARAVPALLRLLEDPDANVRYHAIEALGRLRAGHAVDALAALAEARDFSLAFPALDALAAIGDGRVTYRLVPLLQDELLQTAVVETLGQVGDEGVLASLVALLNNSATPVNTVAWALARLHERYSQAYRNGAYVAGLARKAITGRGEQNLIDALADAGEADLPALVMVVGWLEGPTAERALTGLLGQPKAREAVIDALVRRGTAAELLLDQVRADTACRGGSRG
jgi:HEAT repeat protein